MPDAMDLLSLAWGDTEGYVFFSFRDPKKSKEDQGYWQDVPFKWPRDRRSIATLVEKAKASKKDVYWAPSVFASKRRDRQAVKPLSVLWADLDEVDPKKLPEGLKPTASWRTSPNHYQAVWELTEPVTPEAHGQLNKRLTYAIGADKGGWDLTQVLRTPGTRNWKYDDVVVSEVYRNGRRVAPLDLLSLPEVGQTTVDDTPVTLPDPQIVLRRYWRNLPMRAKRIIKSRNAPVGTRSERLWELDCLLAEAGMSVEEIVAVVKHTPWNKFEGRRDEMSRLFSEVRKAIAHVEAKSETRTVAGTGVRTGTDEAIEVSGEGEGDERHGPIQWDDFDRDHQPIRWLVVDVWGESEVGFISGLPKSYKSWIALDLAVSVATGTPFLGSFQSRRGNVLLVQEEDPKSVIQDRLVKLGAAKDLIWVKEKGPHNIELLYNLPDNLYIISNQGFHVTDEEWFESLEQWVKDYDIDLIILDPLMMMAEGVDEFKAFEMMAGVFKPLKRLRANTQASIAIVHHHIKSGKAENPAALMYGSVALWAWEEAGLHLSNASPGKVIMERFSKHSRLTPLTIEIGDTEARWDPETHTGIGDPGFLDLLSQYDEGASVDELCEETGYGRDAMSRILKRLLEEGKVKQVTSPAMPGHKGRRPKLWKLVG